ncbi:MAG: C13 family peptidase, partial [Alphaproteobacteria bacterium]
MLRHFYARAIVPLLAFAAVCGARAETAPRTWHVFLVAADRAEPVFDNAVDRLAVTFRSRYGIAPETFTSRSRRPAGKRDATWQEISQAVASRRMGANDACLFYFTSHGDEGGLFMARHRSLLPPEDLADLLDRTCGKRPTIVIVSACHSGTFLRPALTTENRVILTAARADRSSFGCAFTETLSVYDRCFLDSWGASAKWAALHTAISACVRAAELARRYRPPSEPQAFFGRLMHGFPVHPPTRRR